MSEPDCCRPLRADAERNRQALLKAALELFAARGLDVSLAEIARRAGVGVATAYRRYPDKSELVRELIRTRGKELIELAEREARREDPVEALEGMLERMLELQARNRGLRELAFGSPENGHYSTYLRRRLAPLIVDLVRRGQASGQLRDDIVASDVPVAMLMVAALAELDTPAGDQLWRRQLRIVLDGLRTPTPVPLPGRPLNHEEFSALLAAPLQQRLAAAGAADRGSTPPVAPTDTPVDSPAGTPGEAGPAGESDDQRPGVS